MYRFDYGNASEVKKLAERLNNAGKADDRQNQYTDQTDFNRHCPIAEYQYLHRLSACFEEKQFYKPQNCGTSFS